MSNGDDEPETSAETENVENDTESDDEVDTEGTGPADDAETNDADPADSEDGANEAPDERDETTAETEGTAETESEADTEGETDATDEVADEDEDDGEESADEDATDETDEAADTEDAEDSDGGEGDDSDDLPAQSLEERLADAEEDLDVAETESDLDRVEERLDAIEADLEEADLPEPDEDDEDAEDPREELESKLDELRDALEDARGPYAEDVVSATEASKSTISDTRWTEQGEGEVADAVETFLGEAYGILDADPDFVDPDADPATDSDDVNDANEGDGEDDTEEYEPVAVNVDRDLDSLTAALDTVVADVEAADLDPDDDGETIAALLDATDTLEAGIEDAQAYDDLTVREKLAYEGFYDVLDSANKKDFPPEWNAIKIYERMGEVEPILLAFDLLGSEFMEEHCIEAFGRMGAPEAFDVMHQRAQRRKKAPIEVLGKIGDERALDTLHPYIEGDSDPGLQKVALKAIGEIGSTESTQHVADRLVADNEEVRSRAARALGLIGDTRAIRPLADVLRDDESDTVRASAAWALTQVGTEAALEAASEYTDDRSFIVQSEAEWAARALGDDENTDGAESEHEQPA